MKGDTIKSVTGIVCISALVALGLILTHSAACLWALFFLVFCL